jgi:hypothetical protein
MTDKPAGWPQNYFMRNETVVQLSGPLDPRIVIHEGTSVYPVDPKEDMTHNPNSVGVQAVDVTVGGFGGGQMMGPWGSLVLNVLKRDLIHPDDWNTEKGVSLI